MRPGHNRHGRGGAGGHGAQVAHHYSTIARVRSLRKSDVQQIDLGRQEVGHRHAGGGVGTGVGNGNRVGEIAAHIGRVWVVPRRQHQIVCHQDRDFIRLAGVPVAVVGAQNEVLSRSLDGQLG